MFKAGIIGLGAIGQRLITGFSNHSEIELAAVCDSSEEIATQTASSFEGVKAFTNHTTMLQEMELDFVYVAVPPKFHHKIVLDVIEKGIHVLCEKPLANSVEEAEELYNKAEKKGIIHAMNFPLNYSPGSRTFASLINGGYIGKIRRIELKMHFPQWPRPWQQNEWVASREQGGYVLEVGVHYIQQIQKIFGDLKLVHRSIQFPEDPKACEIGIIAGLELEDGTPVLIDGLSQVAGIEEIKFTAYGTEGTLSLLNWGELSGAKLGEPLGTIEADSALSDSLLSNLVKKLKGEDAIIIDFQEGYKAQIVLESLRN